MAEKASVWNKDGNKQRNDQGRDPGWYFIYAQTAYQSVIDLLVRIDPADGKYLKYGLALKVLIASTAKRTNTHTL